tara:strand:+ start:361 stop:942 length:582 start_codon:yes stop_codon:yes gene_type:complete
MSAELIPIKQIKPNPRNPRLIKDYKYKILLESLRTSFWMMEARPIVVDENMVVLGGNQRLKACQELNLKEAWVEDGSKWTKAQQDEFIIKDNTHYGEWDYDMLANGWDEVLLKEWGMDVWQPEEDISNTNDYSINSLDEKLNRFLDAKIKNITIPFETQEFAQVVSKLEVLLDKYKCEDYRALIYKIIENEKI